jgi:hypothetical protein
MHTLDIETEIDPRRSSGQRLTCASLVDMERATGSAAHLRQFDESTVMDLIGALLGAATPSAGLIGYNLLSFDLRVLAGYAPRKVAASLIALPHVLDVYPDVCQRAGRRDISLDELARGTLGRARPQHGGDLYRLGQWRILRTHSANGALELADLYRFGCAHQFVTWQDDADGRCYDIPVYWRD